MLFRSVDVNVHPAKTEVKFLNEKAVFDCVHYGVLGALNQTTDRPDVQFKKTPAAPTAPQIPAATPKVTVGADAHIGPKSVPAKKEPFFRTMTTEEYKTFSTALQDAPQPKKEAAIATAAKVEQVAIPVLRENVIRPTISPKPEIKLPPLPEEPKFTPKPEPIPTPVVEEPEEVNRWSWKCPRKFPGAW